MEYLAGFTMMTASILLTGIVWILSGAARLHRSITSLEDVEARRYRLQFSISMQIAGLGSKISRLDSALDKFGAISKDQPDHDLTNQITKSGDIPTPPNSAQYSSGTSNQTQQ